jgi:sugar diacid utilization regulator
MIILPGRESTYRGRRRGCVMSDCLEGKALKKLHEAEIKLIDACYADMGLKYVVNEAAKVLDKLVMVVDLGYEYLAVSDHGKDRIANKKFLSEIERGFIMMENAKVIKEMDIETRIRGTGIPIQNKDDLQPGKIYLSYAVYIHGVEVAHVALYDEESNFSDFDNRLLKRLAKLVAIELQKSNYFKQHTGVTYSFVIGELLERGSTNVSNVRERLEKLGYDLYSKMYVFVIKTSGVGMMSAKLGVIGENLRHIIPGGIYVVYGNAVVYFLSTDEDFTPDCESCEEFLSFLKANDLYAGLSNVFYEVAETRFYYEQALAAIEFGAFAKQNDIRLYPYEDVKIYRIAKELIRHARLEDVCHPAIVRLKQYDERKGTVLLDTLSKYLYFNRSPSHTAQAMNMHRNTLFYTINKIKGLTGLKLEDGDELLNIGVSIKLLDYIEKTSSLK